MENLASSMSIVPPADIPAKVEEAMIAKAKKSKLEMFMLALSAGALIGVGFIYYTTSQMGAADADWYGLTKVVGGLVFSVGLILVTMTGADLFTSTTMSVIPLIRKKISVGLWASHWGIVYLGNFIGALGLALVVFYAGVWTQGHGAWGLVAVNAATAKVSHTWIEAFLLGMLANALVCLAIWMTFAARTLTQKVVAIIGPISLFVASGFEHSIANMFMIPLGILISKNGGDAFWNAEAVAHAGLTPDAVSHLGVGSFLMDNLIPVTIGNIVGGAVLVALFNWRVFMAKHHD